MRNLNRSKISSSYSKIIHDKLYIKYSQEHNYNIYTINNILSNNKSLVVSKFKEFLLYDDASEFLKRFYQLKEIGPRLKKLYYYFHKYVLIQPNYCLLNESKYMLSHYYRKQMVINKQQKNRHNKNNNQNSSPIKTETDKKFFNNTIYDEILNQSESFMNILFGMDVPKKKNENDIDKENDKSIDEIYQFIKLIDKSEKKKIMGKRKINVEKLLIPSNSTYNLKNIHIRKPNNFINSTYSKINVDSKTIINNSNSNIRNILDRYKIHKKIKSLELDVITEKKASFLKPNKHNEINNEITEKNLNDNYLTKKGNRVIYHRKIKTTLIGDYLNKLDLPSNVNIVNSLKKANEAYANNLKNCQNQIGLNKNIKFEPIYGCGAKMLLKNKNFKNFNSNNITRDNTNISNTFGTPMKKEITFSNYSNNIKNTELPNLKKRNKYIKNCFGKIYTININSPKMSLNNSKKMITINDSSSKKYIKKNLLLTSLQNSDIKALNKYNNSNKNEIYSKPKALYQNKNNGFSLKKCHKIVRLENINKSNKTK
jgi:hypothetical protein